MIRPGILVSLKTSVRGGVSYSRNEIEKAHTEEGTSEERAKWETERVIADAEEYKKALEVRGQARNLVHGKCSATSFGLICRLDGEAQLDEGIMKARALVDAFNASSTHSHLSVFVIKGRIASTDEEAARAIGSEVAELVQSMSAAVDALDPEAIRVACNKARAVSELLSEEQQAKVGDAIKQARSAARTIVSRIQKKGEDAAVVALDIQRGAIEKARIAFLDMDGDMVTEGAALPQAQTRALDLDEDPGEGMPKDEASSPSVGEDGTESDDEVIAAAGV